MQTSVRPKRDADVCRLAAVLQRPRRGARAGSFAKDARLLRRKGHRHFERRGEPPRRELGLPLARHNRERCRAVQPLQRSLRHVERRGGGRSKPGVQTIPPGRVIKIRPHRFSKPKPCRRVIGYDTNALYLSTMLR